MSSATDSQGRPSGEVGALDATMVRVVRGEPDDSELAALVAGIVSAQQAGEPEDESEAPSSVPWADHARRLGGQLPGAGVWRWSLHP